MKSLAAKEEGFSPSFVYEQEYIEGFSILMHPNVLLNKIDALSVRDELELQLKAIVRVMPDIPLRSLRRVSIWVEWNQADNTAAVFHPSAVWLQNNGYNPDKAGGVEISNARNFIQWSRNDQPWMVLHELTHAYHYSVLGEHNTAIKAAYQNALAQKLYESVDYVRGGKKRAYALTDAREYFAELSEAYFGRNDHYPFRRADLMTHDPMRL